MEVIYLQTFVEQIVLSDRCVQAQIQNMLIQVRGFTLLEVAEVIFR